MNIKELNKIKELLNNDNYFTWLENYTTKRTIFFNSNSHLTTEDLTEEDINNIKKTALLFNIITYYSNNNYIAPQNNSILNNYYKFNDNNTYYEIGIINHLKNTLSCQQINKQEENSINLNDIKNYFNYYEPNERITFEPTLENLHKLIINLLNNGITAEEIENITHKSLTENKNSKQKILKK